MARDLLGKILVHGARSARIVETEAYLGEHDPAAHASRGLTPRTRVLFGPAGHAYVYLIYGMHECLNIVTGPEGTPGCVLIRAVEPLSGITMKTDGPGKLTRALGITRRHYGADLRRGALRVCEPAQQAPLAIGVSPRIGIRHAADWPLRFYITGNAYVSKGYSMAGLTR